jgi:hypothetical protein
MPQDFSSKYTEILNDSELSRRDSRPKYSEIFSRLPRPHHENAEKIRSERPSPGAAQLLNCTVHSHQCFEL